MVTDGKYAFESEIVGEGSHESWKAWKVSHQFSGYGK